MTTTERHPEHVCFHCKLKIPPDEPEVQVDMKAVTQRLRERGMEREARAHEAFGRRFRHATYERCAELEAELAKLDEPHYPSDWRDGPLPHGARYPGRIVP